MPMRRNTCRSRSLHCYGRLRWNRPMGKPLRKPAKEAHITARSYYPWRKEFGRLKLDQANRLKKLERENAKRKRLVAELSLEKQILKDVAEGNF